MSVTSRALLLLFLVAAPTASSAQTLTSALAAANRIIDWSGAGVSGGIPARAKICAELEPGATVRAINAAIDRCRNGVVTLAAGTYTLSGGITFRGSSNVTLRGAGVDQTILKFTAPDPCGGLYADVCMHGASDVWSGNVPGDQVRRWTAGYAKGTTDITVSSTSGLSVGQMVVLDQLDDASDTNHVYVCATLSCSQEGKPAGRAGRAQQQFVQITAIHGKRLTISPGLYMVNWRASQSPEIWWWGASGVKNGVESMTLDHTVSPAQTGIGFQNVHDAWVKNVKSVGAGRNHIWMNQAARIEVRDSYFYGTKNAASQSYGIEFFATSDDLVVNNIFEKVTAPIMTGNSAGVVVAYNFTTDNQYTVAHWMMAGLSGSHDAGTGMNLFEGNVSNAFLMDTYHGTGNLTTLFRNRLTGSEGAKTANTIPVNVMAYNRFVNVIGNVLGTPGHHQLYESSQAASATRGQPNRSIYVLGYSGVLESAAGRLPYDPLVAKSMLRWGNFDYATRQVRWNADEVPSDISTPLPRTLPPSLFLEARPPWWRDMPWPAIGPDVTGGQDPPGHAHKIPAQACYEAGTKKSDGTRSFNPSVCYGARISSPPSAPTNLIVR
jgi:Right handed beta helix region